MDRILYQYQQLERSTWFYIASLMAVALYFKFSRFWSVRNLDLVGLIAIGPGILLLYSGDEYRHYAFVCLFAVSGFFLVRLLIDPMMVRRPLLEPNLLPGGLTFMGVSLFAFLMGHVIAQTPSDVDLLMARRMDDVVNRIERAETRDALARFGPAMPLLSLAARVPCEAMIQMQAEPGEDVSAAIDIATVRSMAMLSQMAIVVGMVLIGLRHFRNIKTGIAAAGLYLLLPYTAVSIGRVQHALPAALLVWAVLVYHRPLIAGILVGLAAGSIYYPAFLLPLWIGFYWQRGMLRFLAGVGIVWAGLLASLVLTASEWAGYWGQLYAMASWMNLTSQQLSGFWETTASESLLTIAPVYRITVFALFAVLCGSFALWPAQKNLGTLLSCSAAVMLATQFWHPDGGGQYIAWYLPLLLLTIFRPNLEDRVALSVLGSGWPRNRSGLTGAERAA